jgi:hypothetical protein
MNELACFDAQRRTSITCRQESSEMSFDVILRFLRPIAHLIHDPDLSEIMVHCGGMS